MTEKGLSVSDAVARQRDLSAVAARIAEARERAASEQVPVLDATQLAGSLLDHRLSDEESIAQAKGAGHLAVVISSSGTVDYVTTVLPEPEPEPAEEREPEDSAEGDAGDTATGEGGSPSVPPQASRPSKQEEAERAAAAAAVAEAQERKSAAQAREASCARIAGRKQLAAEALRRLTAAALTLGLDARALKLAHRWLRTASLGPQIDDPSEYAAAALTANDGSAQRLAYAMALAADELRVQRLSGWDAEAAAYLRRLMADGEHYPSDWERRRLEEAEGAQEKAAASA